MKYTLKEMCANALKQDLATHDYKKMWCHYYLIAYAAKELLDSKGNALSVADYAALNALLTDWGALTLDDQYYMFEECKDGNWHTTLLKMARAYAEKSGAKYLEHCKSVYMGNIRILSKNMVREIHGDPSLIALQFEDGVSSIPANCYSGNSNLSTVIIPRTTVLIYSKAFADCPNLKNVYIAGEPTIEAGAFPDTATIHKMGGNDNASAVKELEKKVKDLEQKLSATAKEQDHTEEIDALKVELAKSQQDNDALKAEVEKLTTTSSEIKAELDKHVQAMSDAKAKLVGISTDSPIAVLMKLGEVAGECTGDTSTTKYLVDATVSGLDKMLAKKLDIAVPKVVADLITSMLPNGAKMIEKASTDKEFADTVLMSTYDKCLTLRYKFGVQELQRGESLDAKIAALTKHSENDYTKAMSTLKAMADEGLLSSRHFDAIRSLTGEVDKKSTYKEKILLSLEKHGYSESDYETLYNDCLGTVNKTEMKYTSPADYDKLVASRIEEYLNKSPSLEDAIRKHKGLEPDADVSSYIESLKMMKDIMSSSVEGMSEEAALMSLIPRLP